MKLVIVGAGPAGRFAGMFAAECGLDVTLIERSHIAGKCLNHACMVVCALNDVARHINDGVNFNSLGVVSGEVSVDYGRIVENIKLTQRKIRRISEEETVGCGVDYVHGVAAVDSDSKTVVVNGEDEYEYDKLLICTGAGPYIPPVAGVENAYTFMDVLKFKEVPDNLVIIGGGSTAAEFANIFSSFGSNVHILCRSKFLKMLGDSGAEEYVVSDMLRNTVVHENVEIKEITGSGVVTDAGFVEGTVLLATGVSACSDIVRDIVDVDCYGNIVTDEYLQTSDCDIYAAGDVIGGILSTPVSRMEAVCAVRNILGQKVKPDYSLVPMTISLQYDVSYLAGYDVSDVGDRSVLPGAPGPGSFWYTLGGKTGYTRETVDSMGRLCDVLSISPVSGATLPYMTKMIKDGNGIDDFGNFIEIHPTGDLIEKLSAYFRRYNK